MEVPSRKKRPYLAPGEIFRFAGRAGMGVQTDYYQLHDLNAIALYCPLEKALGKPVLLPISATLWKVLQMTRYGNPSADTDACWRNNRFKGG